MNAATAANPFRSLLAAALVLVACACASGDSDNADLTTPITIWQQMDPEERALFATHLERVKADFPGIEFEVSHYATEDLRTQYQTAALAGGGPDLVFGPSDQVGPFSIMGIIHPLDEVMSAELLGAFVPQAFDTLDGHVWALPDQLGNHLTLVYNRALVAEPPQTMDELIALAKANTVDEDGDGRPDRYGLVFEVTEPFWTIPFLTGHGGWVMDADHAPTLDTDAMRGALDLIHAFKNVHAIMPGECDYELSDTMFKEGRAAMIINGPWSWQAYRKAGIDLGLTRIPKIDGRWPGPMVSSKGYSINQRASGERLALLVRLVDALTSRDIQEAFAKKLGTLPTRREAWTDGDLRDDAILSASLAQTEVGRRMPVVPEMRAIWDAMRPAVQSVYNGAMTPADAAANMQKNAVRAIADMQR